MRSKMFSFAIVAIMPMMSLAQNKTYTVKKGDTIAGIAQQFKVRQAELVAVNALGNSHKLAIGEKLRIPAVKGGTTLSVKAEQSQPKKTSENVSTKATYVVRNGDSDWTIARKHDMTVRELKSLNPNIDFIHLKIGLSLAVKGSKATPVVATKSKEAPVAEKTVAKAPVATKTGSYTVKQGDNDWLIARRNDTRVATLKELNPGVDLSKIRPGQIIKIPTQAQTRTVVAEKSTTKKPATDTGKKTVVAEKAPTIRSKHAVVAVDSAIIRRNPSTSADKVTLVDKGTHVAVLDHANGWYKLRFPKGTVGWVRGDLLKPMTASEVIRETNARVASNDTPKAVAKKPTATKTTVAAKPKPSRYSARPANPNSIVASNYGGRTDAVETALGQQGIRYRWGGTSRGGFDCSGLVQYAYNQHGVKLPRTSSEMASAGVAVSRSNMKSGDLILFKTRRGTRVSHVGIYMGNGKFVHASSGKGKVMVSSLNEGYYDRAFVTARRVGSGSASKTVAKKPVAKKIEAPEVDATVIEPQPVDKAGRKEESTPEQNPE